MLPTFKKTGAFASYTAAVLGLLYIVVTALGLNALASPQDPISDPYFTLMESLILLIVCAMTIALVAVYGYAEAEVKPFALTALLFMAFCAGITSCVHFVILATRNTPEMAQWPDFALLFSFRWPSVAYALDILAWDWFFPISMLFTLPVIRRSTGAKSLWWLTWGCILLSFAGLLGVPLANMQVRNIGILGDAVLAPLVFWQWGRQLSAQLPPSH